MFVCSKLSVKSRLSDVRARHREMYWKTHFSWAVRNAWRATNMMTVYFEKHWQLPLDQLRLQLNLESPLFTPLRKNFDR